MSKPTRRRPAAPTQHRYPREVRLSQSLRHVIAEEMVAIDDERLDLVTITSINVDPEMNRATVYFDSLQGEDGDAEITAAFAEHRARLQKAVASQIRSKKTPILGFQPDDVIRSAERIERILRENPSPAVHSPDTADLVDAADDGEA